MTRLLLVDDEPLALARLRRLLDDQLDYQVVAEAASGREAIAMVQQHAPDILLMDIRMPGMDGLEAAKHLMQLDNPPAIIFCTAYDEYALRAFDVQAVGYVLKPVRKDQLVQALERAQRLTNGQWDAIRSPSSVRSHISAKTHLGIELLDVREISHFRAEQKYVVAHSQGREIVTDESLKALEQEFSTGFLRIHRNCLVAVRYIEGLIKSGEGKPLIQLKGVEQPLTISRRHLSEVKQRIKAL